MNWQADTERTIGVIRDVDTYKSIHEIIKEESESGFPGKKHIYKLVWNEEPSNNVKRDGARPGLQLTNRFFAIKVKKQNYLGQQAFAIYLSDYTKKLQAKLLSLQEGERKRYEMTASTYTSTVTHELRTPLLSVVFLL